MRVLLVISSLNDEENIDDCIRSAPVFTKDVIVVDMSSIYRTAEEVKSTGAILNVISRARVVDPPRNYAFSLASGKWILLMDADECFTPKLRNKLCRIAVENLADAVDVSFEVHMFGDIILYSGWRFPARSAFLKDENEHLWQLQRQFSSV